MKTLTLLLLMTAPCFAQSFQEANKILPTVKVVCFKNRIEAEALAQSYKGYEVYQNETQGKIDFCVLPPTHGETIAYITEE